MPQPDAITETPTLPLEAHSTEESVAVMMSQLQTFYETGEHKTDPKLVIRPRFSPDQRSNIDPNGFDIYLPDSQTKLQIVDYPTHPTALPIPVIQVEFVNDKGEKLEGQIIKKGNDYFSSGDFDVIPMAQNIVLSLT